MPAVPGRKPRRLARPGLDATRATLAGVAVAGLLLLGAGTLAVDRVLSGSLYNVAEQTAARDAKPMAGLGLVSVFYHGRPTVSELRQEFAVASRDLPLVGFVAWVPPGKVAFSAGPGENVHPTAIVRQAMSTDRTRSGSETEPGIGGVVEAAVPLQASGQHMVAQFEFSRQGLERALSAARDRLHTLVAVGALLLGIAILPLMGWFARRLPPPIHPSRRRALRRLERALDQRELVVHYQPKIEIGSGRVVGVEALVRWRHPVHGLLAPCEFLPLAETSPSVIATLTTQLLEHAMADCVAWRADGYELSVAVNVTASVMVAPQFVPTVQRLLESHGLPADRLTLEITESALTERGSELTAAIVELRRRLGSLGCTLAQGHHIAVPLPAAELLDWLAERASWPSSLAVYRS